MFLNNGTQHLYDPMASLSWCISKLCSRIFTTLNIVFSVNNLIALAWYELYTVRVVSPNIIFHLLWKIWALHIHSVVNILIYLMIFIQIAVIHDYTSIT